jgi:hypothetical protein
VLTQTYSPLIHIPPLQASVIVPAVLVPLIVIAALVAAALWYRRKRTADKYSDGLADPLRQSSASGSEVSISLN